MEDKNEKYIQGNLPNEERESHEDNLSIEVKKEMAFELGVRKGIEEAVRDDLKAKVREFENRRPSVRIRPWHLGIAASILLIATFTFLLNDSQDLYSEYYEPYPNFEVTVLRGADEDDLISQAYKAYDEANYDLAIEKFAELLDSNPIDVPARFFYGISLMEGEKFKEAISNFGLVKEGNQEYFEASQWYTALCYLKSEDSASAINFLDQLKDSKNFGQKANQLRQEL